MCGLCGVLSTTISDHEFEKFCQLFNVSSLRGEHSSGLFSVKEIDKGKNKISHSVRYMKGVGSSGWFTEHNWKSFKEHIHDSSDTILVAGHCRHATRGSITNANAHPFNFNNIIGMHNGTLSENIGPKVVKNNGKKNKNNNTAADTETDSESFYRYLNDHTLEEALAELRPYSDAYAFVWYDKVKKTLNFIRNNKRPLFFAQNGSTLYWASEREMLMFILNRNFTGYSSNIGKLSEVPPDTLVTFDVTAANPVQSCKVKEVKVKSKHTYTYPQTYRGNNFGWGMDEWGETERILPRTENAAGANDELPFDEGSGTKTDLPDKGKFQDRVNIWKGVTAKADEKLASETQTRGSNVISLPNVRLTDKPGEFQILDKSYSRSEYQRKLEKGCSWCSNQADLADTNHWISHDEYICKDCCDDPEVAQYLTATK